MIYETKYKKRTAIAVRGEQLTAVFLPEDGGKLVSLVTKAGTELMEQAKGETYLPLIPEGSYVDAECSAFDDMFPTIDPCTICDYDYPDHGEVCRIPHSAKVEGNTLCLSVDTSSVPAQFRKEIFPAEGGIDIRYTIENRSDAPLPYLWAGHMLFRGMSGASVFTNAPEEAPIRVMFGEAPNTYDRIGDYAADGESYKYYITAPFSPLLCGIDYPELGKLSVSFTGEAVCWLGVWMNNGSFKGMYNLALEPCTAPYDSPVNAAADGSVLPPRGAVTFTMHLRFREE